MKRTKADILIAAFLTAGVAYIGWQLIRTLSV